MNVAIRLARRGDEGEILRLIRALASFEQMPDAVRATTESLHRTLFAADAAVFAHLAEADGRAVGLSLWFLNYSTWTGKPGLYLEDLFVDPTVRRTGVARAMFVELAREALRRGCARIDFAVLDWNVEAMRFYATLGARAASGWQPWRVDDGALERLAGEES